METFHQILKFLDTNIILSLFPLLLSILLIELIFKNRFKTKQVINLVRWIIIGYTMLSFLFFLTGIIVSSKEFSFVNRATGPYWWAYWIMLFGATVFPFSLLYKKLGSKPIYILLVIFLMKIGFYFERFVIITTSFHRDYDPDNNNFDGLSIFVKGLLILLLQGFIMAIVLLTFFELLERFKTKNN